MLGDDYIAVYNRAVDVSLQSMARREFPRTTHLPFVASSTLVRIEGVIGMKIYEFDVVLKGIAEITDVQADALFSAGCDDGTPASSNGRAWIHFDRETASLEEAIRSAIAQVQSAGFFVAKVELVANAAVALEV